MKLRKMNEGAAFLKQTLMNFQNLMFYFVNLTVSQKVAAVSFRVKFHREIGWRLSQEKKVRS